MRLLILTINYSPEPTGFAPHAAALAEHFARAGGHVTVVTGFPFAPQWARSNADRGKLFRREELNGVHVLRTTHFIPRRPGAAWQRIAMEASFCLTAAALLTPTLLGRRTRPDAILYVGAQPGIAMLARGIAAAARIPYFVNINDLAARAAADVGIVHEGLVQRVLQRLEFAAYREAAGASVLCGAFAEALVAHGYPPGRIRLIRSPIDVDRIRPSLRGSEYRQELGISTETFVVLFAGSMGIKQGLTNVIEAARQLKQRGRLSRPVQWVLVGEGETRDLAEEHVKKCRLEAEVRFLPFQPEDRLASLFAAADVLLLNQLSSLKDTVIPSKLLTYMAAGRPVLAAVNESSQGAAILREADGGMVVAPEAPAALAMGVESLMIAPPESLAAMGARNRAYAERHFDQRKVLAEHESFILERIAGPQRRLAPQSPL